MLFVLLQITDMTFGHTNRERMLGTEMFTACVCGVHHLTLGSNPMLQIFDTETGSQLYRLYDANASNEYARNRACFDYADKLVLNDGAIWDLRADPTVAMVHKFDKLSHDYSAIFHTNCLEVLICGQVVSVEHVKARFLKLIGLLVGRSNK